ncbi:MAG: sugar ABC transporter substrate-binding protein [Clostridia bacterium]
MKRMLVVLLVVVLCMGTASGLAQAENEKKLVIGQVFWGLHDSYQHAHQVQTAKYLEELGIEYIPMDGQMKPEVQTAAMEDLIARGVDGIICQAYDQPSMEISIQAAQDAGIPVVSFVNISSGEVKYPTVEISEEAGAVQMGEMIGKKFKEVFPQTPVKLVTISDPSVEWAHNQRTLAFVEGLKSVYPELEHVFNGGKSDREIAYATMEDVLQRDKGINIIFGYDAENGLGAIAALEAAGRGLADNYVPVSEMVASVDGSTPEILQVMNPASSYVGTLALRPRENARACVDLMLKVIKGEVDRYATDKNLQIPSFVINCWDMDIESTEAFMKEQWDIELDIRAELGL